jgi:hypothetical protein
MKTKVLYFFLLLLPFGLFSQEKGKLLVPYVVENGDTIILFSCHEVDIIGEMVFKNKKQQEKFNKLRRDVQKTYPYAILASVKLKEYNAVLSTMKSEVERDLYMKRAEKELKKQFTEDLKKLTFNQGKILIKLIDRETGSTSYDLVKDLRGSFSAFMWQSVAVMFNSSLKKEYDAKGDDKMIEIIIRQIEDGV